MGKYLEHKSGSLFNLVEEGQDYYKVSPYGGGFITTVPKDNYRDISHISINMAKGIAEIEDDYEYPCYCDSRLKWNGWDTPYFTKETLDKVMEDALATFYKEEDGVMFYRCYEETTDLDECYVVYKHKELNLYTIDGWCFTFTKDKS